jgi:small-conductance mechanosensitive channel
VQIEGWVSDALASIAILLIVGFVGESVIRIIRRAGEETGQGILAVRFVRDVVRGTWIGVAAVLIATVWGITSNVLAAAVIAILSLVVSLSMTTTLQNMIAGAFLLNDGGLREGDWIEISTIKGVVVRVALRNTWVRLESGDMALVGNQQLANGPLVNRSLAARYSVLRQREERYYARRASAPPSAPRAGEG